MHPPFTTIARLALPAVLTATVLGCGSSKPTAPKDDSLRLVAVHALALSEPSDLAIDETGTTLWTVTNDPDSVYQLDVSGNRVKTLAYAGQDLEGIAYDRSDHTLWVAEENLRSVIHLDLDGNVLGTYPLGLTGQQNSGLEGICLNDAGGMFVLNEKLPGLFVTVNPDKSIARADTLSFAQDYSGIAYDSHSGSYWIVSDQSERLYLWNGSAGVIKSYQLPIAKAEGVTIDAATNRIYIVSDLENKLYVWQYAP
ncbi:MAG TPA: SdiA-regulated domain-containing protein [Candidatus Eisenbacteria bacterium]|nr:SdiA-regulated domain-containing protein [Candidatus Eisenbacteria bacterium]